MSEQLWYTWSTHGFGMTTAGFRVRAASRDFMDAQGNVNMQSERFLTLLKYLNYDLPQDIAARPHEANPAQTPTGFVFIDTGQERILVHKVYTGRDAMNRPGAYFSHLLTKLPPFQSPNPSGQVNFSAREAIILWGAPLWQISEHAELWQQPGRILAPHERLLEPITGADLGRALLTGLLSIQKLTQLIEPLRFVIEAFLTRAGDQNKRIYIAAPPEVVAALIWGLTHVLPRTLKLMGELTFSVYEQGIEENIASGYHMQSQTKKLPVIVGTCWQAELNRARRTGGPADIQASPPNDLPARYYESGNPHGFALNYFQGRKTMFTADPEIRKFAEDAIDRLMNTTISEALDAAEKENVQEVPEYFTLFRIFDPKISKTVLTSILVSLQTAGQAIGEAESNFNAGKIWPRARWVSLSGAASRLKQSNVCKSLRDLILKEPLWWQQEGHVIFYELRALVDKYSDEQLAQYYQDFVQRAQKGAQKGKQSDQVIKALQAAVANSEIHDFLTLATLYAHETVERLRTAQRELAEALMAVSYGFAEQVIQSLKENNEEAALIWFAFIKITTPENCEQDLWIFFLQHLSTLPYTPAYQKWWEQSASAKIQRLVSQANSAPDSELALDTTAFIRNAASHLQLTIAHNQPQELAFWQTVLGTIVPFESDATLWKHIFDGAISSLHLPTFGQWWNGQGKKAMTQIRQQVRQFAEMAVTGSLETPGSKIANTIQHAITNRDEQTLAIASDVLATIAPSASNSIIWLQILEIYRDAPYTPIARNWWYKQGQQVAIALRSEAEQHPQHNIAIRFIAIADSISNMLLKSITQQASDDQIAYNLDLMLCFTTEQMIRPWSTLLQKLTRESQKHQHSIPEHYSNPLRTQLLQAWGRFPALGSDPCLMSWLVVSWSELDTFLSIPLPLEWQQRAMFTLLSSGYDAGPSSPQRSAQQNVQQVVAAITAHRELFEGLLEQLFKEPTSQQGAIKFFEFLAQHHYTYTLDLLDMLLADVVYHRDIAEHLLRALPMTGRNDIVRLLETHCVRLLASFDLPPIMLSFITTYLKDFDLHYLDTTPTRGLLERLLKRPKELALPDELLSNIEVWYRIAEFLKNPDIGSNSLRDLKHTSTRMIQLNPEVRDKLANKLLPYLVQTAKTEGDLVRIIDRQGTLLMGRVQGEITAELLLLEQMAKLAGELYGKDFPPLRLIPYITTILGEAVHLSSPDKESYIDRCFSLLLKEFKNSTHDELTTHARALWPQSTLKEWESYVLRPRVLPISELLDRFNNAVLHGDMVGIVNAYDPQFLGHLQPAELKTLEISRQFVVAYQSNNDAALVAFDQEMKGYVRYTAEQQERVLQAQSRQLAQQQAPQLQGITSHKPDRSQREAVPPSSGIAQSWEWEQQAASYGQEETRVIANVLGQQITLADLNLQQELKEPYMLYRISYLKQQLEYLKSAPDPETKKRQKVEMPIRKEELKELEALQKTAAKHPEALRVAALADLVNNYLITENTLSWKSDPTVRWGIEPEDTLLRETLAKLRSRYESYTVLNRLEHSMTTALLEGLRIFKRREMLNVYLIQHKRDPIQSWIKSWLEVAKAKNELQINYKLANVEEPKKGFWEF